MSDRNTYIDKLTARLNQWNVEIDTLEAKAKASEADAKVEYQKHLAEMRAQRDRARAKKKEIHYASDAIWDFMKSDFDKAWDSISQSFEIAVSRSR